MNIISILLIAITILLVACKPIIRASNNKKSSTKLLASENLKDCDTETHANFVFFAFLKPSSETYVLYNINNANIIYSYINKDSIIIIELQTANDFTKFESLKYYTYATQPNSLNSKIHDVTGTFKKHLKFTSAGDAIDSTSIYYDMNTDGTIYEIQLVISATKVLPDVKSIQSTCGNVDYTIANGVTLLNNVKKFILEDYATPSVKYDERNNEITYESISDKRLMILNKKQYSTFYTKDNKICSIQFDGDKIYTVDYLTYKTDNPPKTVGDYNNIFKIAPGDKKTHYIITCETKDGSTICTNTTSTNNIIYYQIVQKKTDTKPYYVFNNHILIGTSNSVEITIEKTAADTIKSIWEGCIPENNISKYTINILMLTLLILIYIY